MKNPVKLFAALGALAKTPAANIVKLPNVSALLPQIRDNLFCWDQGCWEALLGTLWQRRSFTQRAWPKSARTACSGCAHCGGSCVRASRIAAQDY